MDEGAWTVGAVVEIDELEATAVEVGDICFRRRMLAAALGARFIGCSHYLVPPGARQMPVHVHGDEEEIFYILAGSGLSWQDASACPVGVADAVVHRAGGSSHTFIAGDAGLELLAFSSGSESQLTWLPRARVMWAGPRWLPVDCADPFEAEAAAGPLARLEAGPRPPNVVASPAVPPAAVNFAHVRALGAVGGSVRSGLNHVVLAPGEQRTPPHCHALEEEMFVILDGDGMLLVGDQERALRPRAVTSFPPGCGVPHAIRAGDRGISYLAFGTHVPGDSVYYPETGMIALRGLGITLDATHLGLRPTTNPGPPSG